MNLQLIKNVGCNTSETENQHGFIPAADLGKIEILTDDKKTEALEFLNVRPVHTVAMASFIQDNGLENKANRGKYYGYRNHIGELEGIALIGHTTLVEARTDEAMMAFAITARKSETPIYVMMSDGDSISKFWSYFNEDEAEPRLICEEKLFELSLPMLVQNCEWEVRKATADDLEQVAKAHAEVAFLESGTNPLERDREGFLKRCLKRIEKNRTFVVFEDEKLVFKADIVAETENVIYIEGVYVSPDYRGRGIAASCLSIVNLELLERVDNICMLSNKKFKSAHKSFAKAGYVSNDVCTTIFV